MTKRPRRNHSPAFKAKVALEGSKRGTDAPSALRAVRGTPKPNHSVEETTSQASRRSVFKEQ